MTLWYVAKDGDGYTMMEDQALTTPKGNKVVAPGVTMHISRTYIKNHAKIWSRLLDIMEMLVDDDRNEVLKGEMYGLQAALALLMYGSCDENEMRLIQAQADVRYEQEAS